MELKVKSATDLGRRRTNNEDSHAWWIPEDAAERERRGALLVVADGMGGAVAGERASRLAVEALLRSYSTAPGLDPLADLKGAVEAANQAVHAESLTSQSLLGMGTTCTAVVVLGADTLLAHVGDSRAYLVRGDQVRQLTSDHSLVAHLVERGQLTPEQARSDPRRNVVTRSVGVGPRVEVDAARLPGVLQPGDTLLLCSDGLHGSVEDEELAGLAGGADLEEACARLVELANQRGGPDNITLILARVGGTRG
jgi:protein phosphatase